MDREDVCVGGCVCVCNGILALIKKIPPFAKLDGPGGHYAKLNKPDTEIQTLYHLTCMWNLK